MKLANQIKSAETRLKWAKEERNNTEIEVWTAILQSLYRLSEIDRNNNLPKGDD